MSGRNTQTGRRNPERGISLFIVAAALIVLLGMSALTIDLAALYVARNEAQRAADAAALAGARTFITTSFTSGLITQATVQTLATQDAIAIGGQNAVAGQPAQIQPSDVTFDFSTPGNPRITVTVKRTGASGNPVPTFFAKAMGIANANVSATATAEAFNPSGGNLPIGTGCVKPWILPNCDPDPAHGGDPNLCQANFVDPSTGTIVSPGLYPSGTIGQPLTLKQGDPQAAAAPSQFYPIQIPPGTEPALCPDCAQNTGSFGPGAALYARNIACCNTNQFTCGLQVDVQLQTGNMVGPTRLGVQCLTHQLSNGTGQDTLDTTTVPFNIIGGTNNPNPLLQNQIITSSDSIVTIPLYDGHDLCPGGSCSSTVTILGFLQVFINSVGPPQATVNATILNVAGCGAGGSGGGSGGGGGGTVVGSGGSLFPVRLVQP